MRLRYLHLPRCGPLTDASIIFDREDLITRTLNLPRKGSLNFIVGVNGTGKSSVLRVLYRIFRSLSLGDRPPVPVTLAWDRLTGSNVVTALLHYTNRKDAHSFFATFQPVPTSARRQDWEAITVALGNNEPHPLSEGLEIINGKDAFTSPLLLARLPKRLIAYTSGAIMPWEQIEQPVFNPKEEEAQYRTEDERPQGWSMNKEWEEERSTRISKMIRSYGYKTSAGFSLPSIWFESSEETVERLRWELGELQGVLEKVHTKPVVKSGQLSQHYFRVDSLHLRFAGITLALWQAAKELAGFTEELQRDALRDKFITQIISDEQTKDARRVLNMVDWLWPTHLSLTYRDTGGGTGDYHQTLVCLVALADQVINQPLGCRRAVFSLGPSDLISITEQLNTVFPLGLPSNIEATAKRVDGSKTGAEAILRILSNDDGIDSTPLEAFYRLREWEHTGLLKDISLTVKRLHRHESPDGELDDIIVTYDQLSDGEQMLLGRMGLIFLLRGQDGSLLLFDEPETHFNDVWKREIVDMVDMGLLNSTCANVIIATHTSIALTDAFAAEVTVLDKKDNSITARNVSGGLFGTDPGEVTINLFRADSSIGSRSVELLDKLLKTDWKDRENELEAILKILGSSFHRAELRAILKQLRANKNDPASR